MSKDYFFDADTEFKYLLRMFLRDQGAKDRGYVMDSEDEGERKLPHEDFHEVWWISAPERHQWGGVRIAHFRKTINGTVIFFITNEPLDRVGPRDWETISAGEGWVKVKQIQMPTRAEIDAAIDAKLHEVASKIIKEVFDGH